MPKRNREEKKESLDPKSKKQKVEQKLITAEVVFEYVKNIIDEKEGHTCDGLESLLKNNKCVDIDNNSFKMNENITGDKNGYTALMGAAARGQAEAARILVREGKANVEAVNKNGDTALMFAAQYGHTEAARILVNECKANVEAVNKNGDTALMFAAWKGHDEAVRILLNECKADVEAVNKNGDTALMFAAWNGHDEAARILVREGKANVEAVNKNGYTALIGARDNDQAEVYSFLLSVKKEISEEEHSLAFQIAFDTECWPVAARHFHSATIAKEEGELYEEIRSNVPFNVYMAKNKHKRRERITEIVDPWLPPVIADIIMDYAGLKSHDKEKFQEDFPVATLLANNNEEIKKLKEELALRKGVKRKSAEIDGLSKSNPSKKIKPTETLPMFHLAAEEKKEPSAAQVQVEKDFKREMKGLCVKFRAGLDEVKSSLDDRSKRIQQWREEKSILTSFMFPGAKGVFLEIFNKVFAQELSVKATCKT